MSINVVDLTPLTVGRKRSGIDRGHRPTSVGGSDRLKAMLDEADIAQADVVSVTAYVIPAPTDDDIRFEESFLVSDHPMIDGIDF